MLAPALPGDQAPRLPDGVGWADLDGDWRFSRVEETWEVRVDAAGVTTGALVHRRAEQFLWRGQDHFIVRRPRPHMATIGAWAALAVAAVASVAAVVASGFGTAPARPASVIVPLAPPADPVRTPSGPMSRPASISPSAPATRVAVPPVDERAPRTASATPVTAPIAAPVDDTPVATRPVVLAALSRAFASGESEPWADGALAGYVVVGPVDAAGCRPTVVLARGDGGDRTFSHRRCQAASGGIEIRDEG